MTWLAGPRSQCLCRGCTPPHGAGDDIILDSSSSSGGCGGLRSVDSSALTATLSTAALTAASPASSLASSPP